ncbi:MAG: endolytic transglycosylase MltG [Ignavibacteria bacterium]|nr:endolytic transglycosylase MltG [Ignavibacteria bacterium]
MRRRSKNTRLRTGALVMLAVCALGAGTLALLLFAPHGNDRRQPVTIPRGASLMEIGRLLEDGDVVSHGALFAVAAKLSSRGARLQSGTYLFPESISMRDVIAALAAGRYQLEIWVTVPEGATLRSIAALLHAKLRIDSARVIALSRAPSFLRALRVTASTLEGYLFPDTYLIRFGEEAEKVLAAMHERFERALTPELRARMRERGRTLHQTLTMASIVEGETRKASERARVAGVYENRLARGMKLQADPTIQYIIPNGPRRLLYRDLAIDSPYNTYRYRGLPPGPINNPGLEAIRAALYPEKHEFLYFVADGTGGHRFSRNAAEHEVAVLEYRRIQKEQRQ